MECYEQTQEEAYDGPNCRAEELCPDVHMATDPDTLVNFRPGHLSGCVVKKGHVD